MSDNQIAKDDLPAENQREDVAVSQDSPGAWLSLPGNARPPGESNCKMVQRKTPPNDPVPGCVGLVHEREPLEQHTQFQAPFDRVSNNPGLLSQLHSLLQV